VDSAHDVPWLDGADGEQYQIKGAQASTGLDEELGVVADYATALTTQAAHPAMGRAWIDLVLSARGRRALREAGFIPPDEAASSR